MKAELLREIQGLIRPLKVRVANSIARAIVQVVDDQTKLQLLQVGVHHGEDIDDAERVQQYGFTSVPLKGAEAVVVFPNGDRAHALVVAVDDRRHRLRGLEPGEVAIYTDEGDHLKLARGNLVILQTDGLRLGAEGAGEPMVLGNAHKTEYDAHVHPTPFGPTSAPTVPMSALSEKHRLDS